MNGSWPSVFVIVVIVEVIADVRIWVPDRFGLVTGIGRRVPEDRVNRALRTLRAVLDQVGVRAKREAGSEWPKYSLSALMDSPSWSAVLA